MLNKLLMLSLLVSGLVACKEKTVKLDNDEKKASYAIGHNIAKNIDAQKIKVDSTALTAAIADVLGKKKIRMTEKEMQDSLQKMQEAVIADRQKSAEKNKEEAKKYLEENKKKEGFKTTDSGMQYKVITEGKGKQPTDSDVVEVHYKGTLLDGTEFDSSYKRNQAAKFPVKGVIPGWTEALKLMKEGAKYKLVIPPELAYGERGRPGIPANSALIFEVELIKIEEKK